MTARILTSTAASTGAGCSTGEMSQQIRIVGDQPIDLLTAVAATERDRDRVRPAIQDLPDASGVLPALHRRKVVRSFGGFLRHLAPLLSAETMGEARIAQPIGRI